MEGYIKLHRQLQTNKMWMAEPFTRGQAWVDMLLLANHSDGHIRKRGVRVEVKRGQLGWSERKMAERWKWSRGKVRRFLKELEKDENIVPQKNNVTSLITITNYHEFQKHSTTSSTTNGPQTDHKQYQNNNGKKEKNEKKKDISGSVVSKNGIPYEKIISYLNEKANTGYRHTTQATQKKIKARWNEGFRYDDFVKAIDSRISRWMGNPDMDEFLRPDTIFNTKFESYVNAPIVKPKDDILQWSRK
jgi:uncharacterized phage protein (TIGR02220 family)